MDNLGTWQGGLVTKRYRITLEAEERGQLEQLLSKGKADVRRLKHAQILLAADESPGRPAHKDEQIATAVNVGRATVERIRRRFVEEGLELALSPYRGPQRIYKTRLDGIQEAHLIAIACSAPPDGRSRWTLSLLADRMVELKYVDSVSRETVRQTLKKTSSSRS
jgi:transposase